MRAGLVLIGLLLMSLACGTSEQAQAGDDGLHLLTDRAAYAPADTIALTVVNDTNRPLGYDLCTGKLERQTLEGWEPLRAPERAFYEEPGIILSCDLDLRGLEPGGRANESYRLNQGLVPGMYRWCGRVLAVPTTPAPFAPRPFCSRRFEVRA